MGATFLLLAAAAMTAGAATAPPARSPVTAATAQGTATVRILTPAIIGPEYGAPLPGMILHDTTVGTSDGRRTPIRLYEFE